jgi:2-(1,2-epoxy-1,2-dihydrophenyl)acetyl-CoA isomerase
MQTDSPILLDIKEHIAEIRFNRPKALNAINVEMGNAFRDVIAEVASNADVRVIVLSGEGRAFMAGGDLAFMRNAEDSAVAASQLVEPMHAALELLAQAPQPVIASVHGAIAGAGMSVSLFADLVVAADDAVFNMAYVKVGNNPDCSGSWILPRLVGLHKALEIALLADNINAEEALRLGLINRVVPREKLAEETQALASRLALLAPLAVASIKRLMRTSLDNTLKQQLEAEGESFVANAKTADFSEALSAFFEKRPAKYEGR